MKRRTFLLTVVTASAVGVAGCSGDGEGDGSENGNDNGTTDDGARDGGTGDDGASNGDDGSENGGEAPRLGDSYQWQNSFIAEMSFEGTVTGQMTIRSNGGNYHQTLETSQGTFEIYSVDGDIYMVQAGVCYLNPGAQAVPDPDTDIDPGSEEDVTGGQFDLSPAGRGTIDGEEMYVYEYAANGQQTTLYVSVQTGYLRRVEFAQGTIDYHSWGEVDPIEPPAMNCQEFPS